MKYYSEVTRNYYDTEKACLEAEFKVKEEQNRQKILKEKEERERKEKQEALVAARKERANKVEAARKAMVKAQNDYRKELESFCKDYGTYHLSLDGQDAEAAKHSLFDIFNPFLLNF